MVEALKKSKHLLLFLLLILLVSSYFSSVRWAKGEKWEWIISMDGRGYYAYLPALLIYSDPSFSFYEKNTPLDGDKVNFTNITEKGTVNKYFYGEALLLSPFFAGAHLVAKTNGFPLNGYSPPYYFSVLFASLFYFLSGILFLWLLLRAMKFNKLIIFIVCTSFAFGTNLFYYAVYEPSMSHVYSFFAISAFLYFIYSFFNEPQKNSLLFLAFFLGLVLIIRPVNVLILTAIPFIAGDTKHLKNGFLFIFKNYFLLILSLIIIGGLVFGQLLLYYWQTNQFLVWSYSGEGFNFNKPEIINSLFSYMKGFFIYTPLALISIISLLLFLPKKSYLFISGLLPVLFIIYIVSSWHAWHYGWSFGLRAYIDYYPLFAVFLAFLLSKAYVKIWSSLLASTILIAIIALSAIQTYQVNSRILLLGDMNKERYWKVFLKTSPKYENIFSETVEQIPENSKLLVKQSQQNDMEGNLQWLNMESTKEGIAHSGKYSSVINSKNPYSVTFLAKLSQVDSLGAKQIRVGLWIYYESNEANPKLVISFENDEGSYSFNSYPLFKKTEKDIWSYIEQSLYIPDKHDKKDILKVYVINKSGVVYVDDLKINFLK